MAKKRLDGQIAVVTGGSTGYGLGIAQILVEEGVKVWITARNKARLEKAAEISGATAIVADVTNEIDWDKVFDEVLEESAGRLDILINNAGAVIKPAAVADQSDDDIRKCIDVNLTGAILGCARAAKIMRSQKSGTIINIASVCSIEAWPEWSIYGAAKAGLLHLTKGLYTELRPYNVRATCLMPSWGATDFMQAANYFQHPAVKEEIRKKCIQPKELGKLVADICALPAHLAIQELVLWPLVQEVVPL